MARRLAIAFDLPSLAFVTGYLSVGHLATYRSTRVGRTMRWICSDCAWLFAASGCRHFSFSHWNCWRHRVAMRVNQRRAPWSTESLCGQEQYTSNLWLTSVINFGDAQRPLRGSLRTDCQPTKHPSSSAMICGKLPPYPLEACVYHIHQDCFSSNAMCTKQKNNETVQ